MGRNRKTSDELDRKGAFDRNPSRGRSRANEPKPPAGIGEPPPEFLAKSMEGEKLLRAWRDLEATTASVRLTAADRLHFEVTARLLYRTRRYDAKVSESTALILALGKFGLNPSDRSKVSGHGKTEEEETDEWDEFASGGSVLPVQ